MKNSVSIIGRIANDIEVRVGNNVKYARFNVACNRGNDKDGNDLGTDFIPCCAFEKRADALSLYSKKGDLIGLDGTWRTSSYEQDGKKVKSSEMIIGKVYFLTPKEKGNTNATETANEVIDITSDDLPF